MVNASAVMVDAKLVNARAVMTDTLLVVMVEARLVVM